MPPAALYAPENANMSSSSDSEDETMPMRQWPHPPRPPQPVISNTVTRRDHSMPLNNSRRDKSMKSPSPFTLPLAPPPDHSPSVKRSRSTVSSGRNATNTDSTVSSALPPGWTYVSRKVPGVVPKSSARSLIQHGGVQASTWRLPVNHNMPTPVILPVHHDIHTDDEHPAAEVADSMLSISPCDDEGELYPFDMLFSVRLYQRHI
jgi:hypothetical protein